jgi:hypothetical protein
MRFQKGNTYSPSRVGHVNGTRTRLSRKLLEDLAADWAEGGIAAIKIMRMERPAEYCKLMVSILPKELIFENSAVTDLSDDELDHMIEMLREGALAARQEQAALEMVPAPKLLNGRH